MNLKEAIKSAGSGARGAKFEKIGQIQGGAVESAEIFQSRDDDGNLETWDDSSPKMKLRIIVQTDLDEGADDSGRDDDGRRALYIKWWGGQRKEFLAAMEKAGLDDLTSGCKAFAKYVSDGERAKKNWSAPKNMRYKFVAPPNVPVDDFGGDDEVDDEPPAKPTRRAVKPAAKPAPEPEPEIDEAEDFNEVDDEPPAKAAPARKAPAKRKPAPEPEDDDLDGVDGPVDDTAGALSAAGLGDDF